MLILAKRYQQQQHCFSFLFLVFVSVRFHITIQVYWVIWPPTTRLIDQKYIYLCVCVSFVYATFRLCSLAYGKWVRKSQSNILDTNQNHCVRCGAIFGISNHWHRKKSSICVQYISIRVLIFVQFKVQKREIDGNQSKNKNCKKQKNLRHH